VDKKIVFFIANFDYKIVVKNVKKFIKNKNKKIKKPAFTGFFKKYTTIFNFQFSIFIKFSKFQFSF